MKITIPKLSLIVLVGPSGSGKSTFARKHFLPTEVLSSDHCRAMVCDDENDQTVTQQAFEIMHFIVGKRLAAGKLTVIDATNVQPEARKPLVQIARDYHCIPVVVVFNLPERVCVDRNAGRSDRDFGAHVIRQQRSQMKRSLRALKWEGFRHIFEFGSEEQVNTAEIERVPLWNDKTDEHGPFDIIGDVHGCFDELAELLERLGYVARQQADAGPMCGPVYAHPEGRKAVFLGDVVDRGPRILDCLKLVRNMVAAGHALCVPGNHDMKLVRKLGGKDVQITHGLEATLAEIDGVPEADRQLVTKAIREFLDDLVSHYVLDAGRLVVAHAGLRQEMQGRGSGKVRDFCLYGETTGETDEFGLPVRHNWAAEYRGQATVVYGHTPVVEPEWLNNTINVDTGCVFGGSLTALRYPERDLVSVDAKAVYCQSVRPLQKNEIAPASLTAQQTHDDLLDAEDVLGKRFITTRLCSTVTIRQENATAALEVMSRFATNPKWLIYLPPTMSPSETSQQEGHLEYPGEAFAYFRSAGVAQVICEQKHMGSRAVVVVCRDEQISTKRFGVAEGGPGVIYTRTGRRFFERSDLETEFLRRIQSALEASGFWEQFQTDWVCLDCELMPWSAKAQELLKCQYAATGAAATASLAESIESLRTVVDREGVAVDGSASGREGLLRQADAANVLGRFASRLELMKLYVDAYRRYCWSVNCLDDFRLAPFHILATEGKVHVDQDHRWHMTTLSQVCACDERLLLATPYQLVDVTIPESQESGTNWWRELTDRGGEGMVVKPLAFVARGRRGLVQPALKCRGREYLRIIYGPEYTLPENLTRLRARSLHAKRSLALREFALGVEALERFVRREPLRRVHECVFGVLALESEPVDPRL
jgi:protein phosphatase